jgi:hypothetical protein
LEAGHAPALALATASSRGRWLRDNIRETGLTLRAREVLLFHVRAHLARILVAKASFAPALALCLDGPRVGDPIVFTGGAAEETGAGGDKRERDCYGLQHVLKVINCSVV